MDVTDAQDQPSNISLSTIWLILSGRPFLLPGLSSRAREKKKEERRDQMAVVFQETVVVRLVLPFGHEKDDDIVSF